MNPEPASPDSEWDDGLASHFAAASVPPTPADLAARVRGRLRHRRHLLRALAGTAAATVLLASVLVWRIASTLRPTPKIVRGPDPEPLVLDVAPPVGKLDLLAQHQAAYLEALEQMQKEF